MKSLFKLLENLIPKNRRRSSANIEFQSNGILTLGTEIELQFIDKETLYLTPSAEKLLAAAPSEKIKPELYLDMIELNTSKCTNANEVYQDLSETIEHIKKIADTNNISLAGTGCHPLSKYSDCDIYPSERYNYLIDRNQWLARRWKVYGLHVHIGMASGEDCIRYNNFFMRFLPHLLALSASAPFWQEQDTGLATCRPTIGEALPTAGHPYYVQNWQEFVALHNSLQNCKAIGSLKDLWWDLRPNPTYGTLEIRVCDSPATLTETVAIVAFIHVLAHWFQDHGDWLQQVAQPPSWILRENKWRVIRHGLNADIITSPSGQSKPLVDDIREWVNKTADYTYQLGYSDHIQKLLKIVANGNSSTRQNTLFSKTKSLHAVVKHNIDEFNQNIPAWES